MQSYRSQISVFTLIVLSSVVALSGCTNMEGTTGPTVASSEKGGGKIPVTTASEEARKEFLLGRDLSEKLRIQDSIKHFDKAIALDPNFALAELNRANVSPTGKEFFEHLSKAVTLSGKASNGERLLILGNEAGANGDAPKQKEYLEQLVAAYPNDERAHFQLGGYHFGQQEIPQAIEHYKKATELQPDYSAAYNILGYAYRQAEDYANAEKAFQKYIQLIPNDPNPYDSYAELLLKMGRFDESIVQYRRALSIDPNFVASHSGISADLMYQNKPAEAASELLQLGSKARSDAETRTALFNQTVVDVDSGQWEKALAGMDKQYALGQKTNDIPAMTGDLQFKGNIYLEMGKYDEAKELFDRLLKMTQESTLSQEIKDNAKLFHHFNLARVAVGKKDLTTAKAEAAEFEKGALAKKNPFQAKLAHGLNGLVALEEKNYDKALAELQQANLQNPYDLFRTCLAYQGKGDAAKAKEFCTKTANFNPLPQLNHAFVRTKAAKIAAS